MDVARPDLKQRRVKQRKMVLAAVTVCALGFVAAALWIGNARPNVDQADVLIDVVERVGAAIGAESFGRSSPARAPVRRR